MAADPPANGPIISEWRATNQAGVMKDKAPADRSGRWRGRTAACQLFDEANCHRINRIMRISQIDHLKVTPPPTTTTVPAPPQAAFVGFNPRPQIKSCALCVAIRKFVISGPELITANQAHLSSFSLPRGTQPQFFTAWWDNDDLSGQATDSTWSGFSRFEPHAGERRHIDYLWLTV